MKKHSPEWLRRKEENRFRREKFVRSLTTEDKVALADSWVKDLGNNSETHQSCDQEVRMCISDTSVGFEMIELIWKRLTEDDDRSYLGVIVEDWLAIHGTQVIARLEQLTVTDPEFANVLQYVYRNTMPKSVYIKIKELAGSSNA